MSTPSRAASICPPIVSELAFERASDRPAPVRATLLALVAALATGLAPQPVWADRAEHAEPAAVPLGGTLHVCIDASGMREYRDIPCAAHQQHLRAVKFVRAPVASAQPARDRETASAAERRHAAALVRTARIAAARASARASEHARKAPDPCKAARARREDARERATSGLSFDQLRRLDREVWRLCPNG